MTRLSWTGLALTSAAFCGFFVAKGDSKLFNRTNNTDSD
ncbi:hypothetical protein SAMN00790413_00715 [Deinococcus hopiensis KR-140]|uniref:Uncharacterized protein n=1 Tax=Deinococcus hopiensis KR-140 TaxID=695939 RepID=A0A1W1VAE8_9DEIO|nr:hypothetical protein SAMN00790413_00715 [Deinococcus hopiensis KR-140]